MKGAGRIFQRQYEKGGEREHKLTLNLLLPHLSVNFTLLPFFVQTFQCDSIDCPLLLHKRIQSCLWECVCGWGSVSVRVKLSHIPSCSPLKHGKVMRTGLGLNALMSILFSPTFETLQRLHINYVAILTVIKWVRCREPRAIF